MAKLYKAPIFLQVSLDVTNWPISWLIRVEMRHVFLSPINRKRFDTLRMKGIPLGKSVQAEPAFPRLYIFLVCLFSHLMLCMRKTDPLSAQTFYNLSCYYMQTSRPDPDSQCLHYHCHLQLPIMNSRTMNATTKTVIVECKKMSRVLLKSLITDRQTV